MSATRHTLFSHVDFEDRNEERNLIGSFVAASLEDRILWINGVRGCGKSYLVKQVIKLCGKDQVVVNPSAGKQIVDGFYLHQLVGELEKLRTFRFTDYIRNNYVSLFEMGASATKAVIKSFLDIDIDAIVDAAAGAGKIFLGYSREFDNLGKALSKYLCARNKKFPIVLVLDNFSKCDEVSLDVVKAVIDHCINKSDIRVIAITTSEDLAENLEVQEYLASLSAMSFPLTPFDDPIHFARILSSGFECHGNIEELASLLQAVCKGKPQLLVEAIRRLYDLRACEFNGEDKPVLSANLIKRYVMHPNGETDSPLVKPKGLQEYEVFESAIIRCLCLLDQPIREKPLLAMLSYICQSIDIGDVQEPQIIKALDNLLFDGTLVIDDESETLQFGHDIDRLYFNTQIKGASVGQNRLFCNAMAEYLNDQGPELLGFGERNLRNALARLSYQGLSNWWLSFNKKYGTDCFRSSDYSNAFDVFDRIYEYKPDGLTSDETVMLVESALEVGRYQKCIEITAGLEWHSSAFTEQQHIRFKFAEGRAHHLALHVTKAVRSLNEALDCATDQGMRYQIVGCLISALRSDPSRKAEASDLFLRTTDKIKRTSQTLFQSNPIELCGVLRNASFFLSTQEAQQTLEYALDVARAHNNSLEEAFITNNIGVVYLKSGSYDAAEELFRKSARELLDIRPFEAAYPLQNLSTLALLRHDVNNALNHLDSAKRWARSAYVKEAIANNSLVAYMMADDKEGISVAFNRLNKMTADISIENMLITSGNLINLALAAQRMEEASLAKELIEQAVKMSRDTDSEYRSIILCNRLTGSSYTEPKPLGTSDFYTTTEFDPFSISIAHG